MHLQNARCAAVKAAAAAAAAAGVTVSHR